MNASATPSPSALMSAAARAAHAEGLLRSSGLRQFVVLGAGLDTAASRAPGSCAVWHVDLPGVSMYLDADGVRRTFESLGALAPGSELVFDHIVPPADRDDAGADYARAVSAAVGAQGEPWRYTPPLSELEGRLDATGWSTVASVRESDSVPAGFWARSVALRPMELVRFTHARLSPPPRTGRDG